MASSDTKVLPSHAVDNISEDAIQHLPDNVIAAYVYDVTGGGTFTGTPGKVDYFILDYGELSSFSPGSANQAQVTGFDPSQDKIVIEHTPDNLQSWNYQYGRLDHSFDEYAVYTRDYDGYHLANGPDFLGVYADYTDTLKQDTVRIGADMYSANQVTASLTFAPDYAYPSSSVVTQNLLFSSGDFFV